jgi:hypothetical protein
MPISDSVVEEFVLTSPLFKDARAALNVDKDHPWTYPYEVYAHGLQDAGGIPKFTSLVSKLLEEKYGNSYSEARAKAEPPHFSYGMNAGPSWGEQVSKGYNTLLITEQNMDIANGGTGKGLTLISKWAEGKFTDKDRENIEFSRKKARGEAFAEESGLNTIDFSGKSPMSKGYLIRDPITGKLAGTGRHKTRGRKGRSKKARSKRSLKDRKTRRRNK